MTAQKVAADLRKENAKKNTQNRVALLLGVTQQCVAKWLNGSNTTSSNTSAPDARVKIPPQARPVVRERVEAGESDAAPLAVDALELNCAITALVG